jgi:hypothetical protein
MQALGGRKSIDPNWLKQHFGSQQISSEFVELMNTLINSPQGQKMMSDAAEQGSQMQNEILRQQANAGLSPGEGASSGSSIFAAGAAPGATAGLQRDVKSRFAEMALPIAAQNVNNRMGVVTGSMQGPTAMEKLGGTLGTAASLGLQARGAQLAERQTPSAPVLASPAMAQQTLQNPNMMAGGIAFNAPSPAMPMRQPGHNPSRFGRKISRFGARLGNLVTPGNPFGYAQQ